MKRLPVTLLTGFLGSGKTTLLRAALSDPAFANTALIVNEFGEIGIDHLLVADLAENIVELRDGCLCCTIRGDLVMTLRDLYQRRCLDEIPRFERIVVETTGLADPIPLIHTLMANPPLMRVFELDAVICMVDGVHGGATLSTHETAANQVALADLVVISKTDLIDAADLAGLERQVRAINPGAEIIEAVHGAVPPARLLDRGAFQPRPGGEGLERWLADTPARHHDHGGAYDTHVIRHPQALSLAGTSVFLNHVVNEFADNILRIKGLAGFREKGGRPAVLHAVQNKFYPVLWLDHWPDSDHDSRLVFIGRELDTAALDERFARLCV